MRMMAEGEEATLIADPTQERFDRYGRLLAYLYVGGRNLDRVQVRDGWGYVYVYEDEPFELVRGFRQAQESAEREGAGVWSKCRGDFHSAEPGTQN
jgi:micrococcal nuclease